MQEHDYEVMRICVRAYMKDIRAAVTERDYLREELEAAYDIKPLTYEGTGGGSGSIDGKASRVLVLKEKISALDDYLNRQVCIQNAWDTRGKYAFYVLWRREVDRVKYVSLARELGITARHVRNLYEKGIAGAYDQIPEEYRRYAFPPAEPLEFECRS